MIQLSSAGDSRLDSQVQAASSDASYNQAQTTQLESINSLFDITGTSGILAAFQQFGAAFQNLSVNPQDPVAGTAALASAGQVANAIRKVATSLDQQGAHVDTAIQSTVAQINTLAAQIQRLNLQARGQTQPDPGTDATLRSSLDQLSSLVDITATKQPDGTVSVLAGGELPLVLGDRSFTLSATASPSGYQITSSGGGASPGAFSGQLGGLLRIRNGVIDPLLSAGGGSGGSTGSLNTLAAGFASRVNTLLASGVTTGGTGGVPIFTFDFANPANVARTLALNGAVTPGQLGVGSTGAGAQSNGVASQLAALAGSVAAADHIAGLSANDYFGSLAASIGQKLSDARTATATSSSTLTTAQSARQQVSGVSLDQEAVTIVALQRSYEASARAVSILDQLTGDEVNLIK